MDTCSCLGQSPLPSPPFTWLPVPSPDGCPRPPPTSTRPPLTCSPTPSSNGSSPSPSPPSHPGTCAPARQTVHAVARLRAKRRGPRGPRGCGGAECRRVTVRESGPEPAGRARVRGEPAWARRGRVRGAGVRARVCARPRRSAGRAGGGGGVRTPGTPPPAPRPAPAQPPASVRAAPRLRAQRRRLPEPSGAHRLRPRRRCGAAPRPPQSRPRPPREGAEPLPHGWRTSPRSPSACSCGCSCRRCPAPGRRAPQVSAPPTPAPSPARPGVRRWVPGGESCAGSRGLPEPGSPPAAAGCRVQARPGQRARLPASLGRPRSVKCTALLSCRSPGSSNFLRPRRIFPLAASHLSESVTRVFGAAR